MCHSLYADIAASVRGTFRIINLEFLPAYNDSRSLEYFEITQTIIDEVIPKYCMFCSCVHLTWLSKFNISILFML